mgnify:CR=1 FL=1
MKRIFSGMLFFTLLSVVAQQQIPNGNFELWITDSLYVYPAVWESSVDLGRNIKQSTDRVSGNYSLYMETVEYGQDTVFGYFVNGDGENMLGGQACTVPGDSITAYFKYAIEVGDTALVFVGYKNSTTSCSSLIKITGTQSNWKKITFAVDTIANPDSLIIVVACSNAFGKALPGSYMFIDSMALYNSAGRTADIILNADFET